MRDKDIESLLISRGKEGTSLFLREQKLDFRPLRRIRASDTTGAGDRLLAELLHLLDRQVGIEEAVPEAMKAVEEALEEGRL